MFPDVLDGTRFELRKITAADTDAVFAFWRLPEVYETTSADPWTREAVHAFTEANEEGAAEGRWCRYGIVLEGRQELAGTIGLVVTEARFHRAELGYDLAPGEWGRGLMSAAANRVLDLAFGACGFHRVEATVMEGNVRSEGVLRRLGFQREANLRDYKLVRGAYRDFSLWSLLSTDVRPDA